MEESLTCLPIMGGPNEVVQVEVTTNLDPPPPYMPSVTVPSEELLKQPCILSISMFPTFS